MTPGRRFLRTWPLGADCRRAGRRIRRTAVSGPVLSAPVSAAPTLFSTVRARPGPFRPVKPPPGAAGGGFDGTERTGTCSNGREQGRSSADGCGEDRALVTALTPLRIAYFKTYMYTKYNSTEGVSTSFEPVHAGDSSNISPPK